MLCAPPPPIARIARRLARCFSSPVAPPRDRPPSPSRSPSNTYPGYLLTYLDLIRTRESVHGIFVLTLLTLHQVPVGTPTPGLHSYALRRANAIVAQLRVRCATAVKVHRLPSQSYTFINYFSSVGYYFPTDEKRGSCPRECQARTRGSCQSTRLPRRRPLHSAGSARSARSTPRAPTAPGHAAVGPVAERRVSCSQE